MKVWIFYLDLSWGNVLRCFGIIPTLPETNRTPENRPLERRFLLETTICGSYVSFREGTVCRSGRSGSLTTWQPSFTRKRCRSSPVAENNRAVVQPVFFYWWPRNVVANQMWKSDPMFSNWSKDEWNWSDLNAKLDGLTQKISKLFLFTIEGRFPCFISKLLAIINSVECLKYTLVIVWYCRMFSRRKRQCTNSRFVM